MDSATEPMRQATYPTPLPGTQFAGLKRITGGVGDVDKGRRTPSVSFGHPLPWAPTSFRLQRAALRAAAQPRSKVAVCSFAGKFFRKALRCPAHA